jgi:hypothetical protein
MRRVQRSTPVPIPKRRPVLGSVPILIFQVHKTFSLGTPTTSPNPELAKTTNSNTFTERIVTNECYKDNLGKKIYMETMNDLIMHI